MLKRKGFSLGTLVDPAEGVTDHEVDCPFSDTSGCWKTPQSRSQKRDLGHLNVGVELYLPVWNLVTIFSVMVRCNTGDESTVAVDVVP